MDIEDLAEAGRRHEICPYFGSRAAIPQAQVIVYFLYALCLIILQLVLLPYNLLLHQSAREALGIDLTDQIVVIDEAHSMRILPY
jgi:chromosome transmission fidelity protein 1